jgi:hypothetical protein
MPFPQRAQVVGYGLGLVLTLVFLSWLARSGLE